MKKLSNIILFIFILSTWSCKMVNAQAFSSKENIEKYVLSELKKEYGVDFQYPKYWQDAPYSSEYWKTEKLVTIMHFSGLIEPIGASSQDCQGNISVDSTGFYRDSAHIFFYKDRIIKKLNTILDQINDKKYSKIKIVGLEREKGKWTGKESLDEYIKGRDFESWVYIYLPQNLTDEQYAAHIKNILTLLYEEPASLYNITLKVLIDDNNIDSSEKIKGTCIFFQDLDQENLNIDSWTFDKILFKVKLERGNL
jgi:hypothetical protein